MHTAWWVIIVAAILDCTHQQHGVVWSYQNALAQRCLISESMLEKICKKFLSCLSYLLISKKHMICSRDILKHENNKYRSLSCTDFIVSTICQRSTTEVNNLKTIWVEYHGNVLSIWNFDWFRKFNLDDIYFKCMVYMMLLYDLSSVIWHHLDLGRNEKVIFIYLFSFSFSLQSKNVWRLYV